MGRGLAFGPRRVIFPERRPHFHPWHESPALNRPLPAPTALLLGLLAAASAFAGSPAGTLLWTREAAPARESLLLVLQGGPRGWSLLDARRAAVPAKPRRGRDDGRGPVLALLDARGEPLAVLRLELPAALHGPVLDEEGRLRCVAVAEESPVLAVRLPHVEGAAALELFAPAAHAPREAPALVRALAARPEDSGLERLARFELGGRP